MPLTLRDGRDMNGNAPDRVERDGRGRLSAVLGPALLRSAAVSTVVM